MLQAFRALSLLEGLSFLLILSVTIGLISRDHVYVLGMCHGVLFLLYLIASLLVSSKMGWSLLKWLLLFMASVTPFAFIAVEIFLKKQTPADPALNADVR